MKRRLHGKRATWRKKSRHREEAHTEDKHREEIYIEKRHTKTGDYDERRGYGKGTIQREKKGHTWKKDT